MPPIGISGSSPIDPIGISESSLAASSMGLAGGGESVSLLVQLALSEEEEEEEEEEFTARRFVGGSSSGCSLVAASRNRLADAVLVLTMLNPGDAAVAATVPTTRPSGLSLRSSTAT